MAMRQSENEILARAYIQALNAGDADAVAACVSDDFVNEHTSSMGESVVGRDNYRQRLVAFLAEFRELRYEIEAVIADGQRIALPYRMSARWIDANGEQHPFTIRGMFRFQLRDGLICHRVDYWDSGDFQRQVETG